MTYIVDPFALLAIFVVVGLIGFAIGRISTTPADPPSPVALSSHARAHIAYEAIRAYQRSMGVIRLKSFNNLDTVTRELLTESMRKLRSGDAIQLEQASVEDRIQAAFANL